MPPYRQDLSKAQGGTVTGRGGGVQQLGKAALSRLPTAVTKPAVQPPPAVPNWKRLADAGQAGTGSVAGNRAAAAKLPGAPAAVPPTPAPPARPPWAGRGMASFLKPMFQPALSRFEPADPGLDNLSELPDGADMGADGAPPADALAAGVTDAAGAAPAGASPFKPNFAPGVPGGGQAARIAALLARLGGGGTGLQF